MVLVPPSEKLLGPSAHDDTWMHSSELQFNGTSKDCFAETSMHLSFSNYHVPIVETDMRGLQDSSVSVLESIVSVHNRGDWIADINILGALGSHQVFLMPPSQPCSHPERSTTDFPMLSIDSWDRILDLPKDTVVIPAHKNWAARLAIVAFLIEHREEKVQRIIICPSEVCWKCVKLDMGSSGTCTIYVH